MSRGYTSGGWVLSGFDPNVLSRTKQCPDLRLGSVGLKNAKRPRRAQPWASVLVRQNQTLPGLASGGRPDRPKTSADGQPHFAAGSSSAPPWGDRKHVSGCYIANTNKIKPLSSQPSESRLVSYKSKSAKLTVLENLAETKAASVGGLFLQSPLPVSVAFSSANSRDNCVGLPTGG